MDSNINSRFLPFFPLRNFILDASDLEMIARGLCVFTYSPFDLRPSTIDNRISINHQSITCQCIICQSSARQILWIIYRNSNDSPAGDIQPIKWFLPLRYYGGVCETRNFSTLGNPLGDNSRLYYPLPSAKSYLGC